MIMLAHIFKFSRNWRDGKRLCGECHQTYDAGDHEHIAALKPYTSYVCPNDGDGGPHSSVWSGAQNVPELRGPNDAYCRCCGAQYVEEDREVWRLSWEYVSPWTGDWTPCERLGTNHSTEQQCAGLLSMPDEIRNVQRKRLHDEST